MEEKFLFLAQELKRRGAAYIHAVRRSQPAGPAVSDEFLAKIPMAFGRTFIVKGGVPRPPAPGYPYGQLNSARSITHIRLYVAVLAKPEPPTRQLKPRTQAP